MSSQKAFARASRGSSTRRSRLDKKVDRLIASNAVEHAAFQEFVTDHEVRITRLEAKPGQDPESPVTHSA